jgi:hypothetical protein
MRTSKITLFLLRSGFDARQVHFTEGMRVRKGVVGV